MAWEFFTLSSFRGVAKRGIWLFFIMQRGAGCEDIQMT